MNKINIYGHEHYFNRELGQLAFNARVLANARDIKIPLLERLRFAFIAANNLDEFFEVRVAGLKEQAAIGSPHLSIDGQTPEAVLAHISQHAHQLVSLLYDVLYTTLLPLCAQQHINILSKSQWTPRQADWIGHYFHRQILPVLSPIGLDLAHPFPRLVNKSLNFLVSLKGKDAFGRDSGLAIVHAPRALARVIKLPDHLIKQGDAFVFLSSIIKAHIAELFPGMTIKGCYAFRLTRNSELFVQEEEIEDLALALKTELLQRHYGNAVRLEIDSRCPEAITQFLLQKHGLQIDDVYYCQGPVNLSRYMQVLVELNRTDLEYPTFKPLAPDAIAQQKNIFECLQRQDILLHHPYQSFNTTVDFVYQAATDDQVIAIKQTLYRTHSESTMVQALVKAARAGKEVTAVIELRARFDEESNLRLADLLQDAGALVVYGIVGYKTHAKMTLVVRREGQHLRRYAHLGTGNYHESTSKQYTDLALLTHDKAITRDVQQMFHMLTGMGRASRLKKCLASPFTLFKHIKQLIEFECEQAHLGKKALIRFKVNGLTDPATIQLLYKASQAGVKIELLVRGICCLKPGIKDISSNIKVKSIVGRFLEHSRVYYFYHHGEEMIYCASADLMERNLYHRVECAYPIEDARLKQRIKTEVLEAYWQDNQNAWQLNSSGDYSLIKSKRKAFCAQDYLLQKLSQLQTPKNDS